MKSAVFAMWKLWLLVLLAPLTAACSPAEPSAAHSPGPHAASRPPAAERPPPPRNAMHSPDTVSLDPRGRSDSRPRLRVLCLHGYHGSGDTVRAQMRALMAGVESFVDFVCVEAPSLAAGDFGWWHAKRDDDPGAGGAPGVGHRPMRYEGWERTRAAIVSLFEREGPFDGVFGFSQGAALTGLLVVLRAPGGQPTPQRPLSFSFAMMVGGFVSNDPSHAGLYASRDSFDVPSLHLVGRSDSIVPLGDSRELAARFKEPLVLEHDGGHVIASDPAIRASVGDFLREMWRRRGIGTALPVSGKARPASSGQPLEVPLWPSSPRAAIKMFFPEAPRSTPAPAILVFQGGAYATSAGSGGGAAEWIAAHGMVGIEVPYRTRATGDAYPAS